MKNFFSTKLKTGSGTSGQVTGKAADSGYTKEKKAASQAANRQTVQSWWQSEQAKTAQDNSTNRAYTAKLTGGANIDNSADVLKSIQRTFGGVNDSADTQYKRTMQSKLGYGQNWGSPQSTVGNAIESGVAGTAAGWLNAAGTALKSSQRGGLAVDSGNMEAKATGNEWYSRAGSYLQNEADRVQQISENAYTRGSKGLNNAQTMLFDGAVAGTQMAGDLALGALTGGSATIPMAIRGFGSASQQARQAGATENQQIAYGAASALKEVLTEKMFDGLAGVYGKGTADDLVDSLARRFAKSDGGQAVVRGLVNMGGEGLEEVVSGFADPALQGIYNGKALGENYSTLNLNDILHEGAVGMLLGGLGGMVNMAQTGYGTAGRTELSTPYSDMLQLSTPYSDAMNATTTENQVANHPEQLRYQELLQKFLDGSIAEHEFEELRKLENVWGQFDEPNGHMDRTWETGDYTTRMERERNNAAAKSENDHLAAKFFGVNGTGDLSPIIKRSTIKTQGGFECFPDGDPLKRNIQNVQPINNYFDVAMHGTPDAVCFGGTERNMTARVLASVIRHSEGWNGQNVRLLSCSTGARERDSLCFAEELANALGVTVLAPNLPLYISERGTFQVGKYGEGAFVEYNPNERRRLK